MSDWGLMLSTKTNGKSTNLIGKIMFHYSYFVLKSKLNRVLLLSKENTGLVLPMPQDCMGSDIKI